MNQKTVPGQVNTFTYYIHPAADGYNRDKHLIFNICSLGLPTLSALKVQMYLIRVVQLRIYNFITETTGSVPSTAICRTKSSGMQELTKPWLY